MHPESDLPGNEPNLELPSFGFGRKKRRGKKSGDSSREASAAAPEADGSATAADEPTEPRPAAPRAPAAPPAPARIPGAGPTPARAPARPPARPPSRPAAATPPAPAPAKPAPARPPVRPETPSGAASTSPPVPPVRPTTRPAESAPPAAPAPPAPEPEAPLAEESAPPPAEPDVEHTAVLDEMNTEAREAHDVTDPLDQAAAAFDDGPSRRERRKEKAESRARRRAEKASRRPAPAEALVATLPEIKPIYAAIITGALSGLAAVALAIGASRGCEAVRDNSSCGGSVGLLALVAILAIEVLIGANLLKAWRISDPFSTSFLGVGLVSIIAMLFFLDSIDSVWMLLAIPALTAAAFLLSWWVTVRIIDEEDPFESDEEDEEEEIGQFDAEDGDRSDA